MPQARGYLLQLLKKMEELREKNGLTRLQVEEELILGPGWISRFENGETIPSVDMVLAILHKIGASLPEVLEGLPEPEAAVLERNIFAEQSDSDVNVHFCYANFDALYTIPNSTLESFTNVIKILRDGLAKLATFPEANERGARAQAIKAEAITNAFIAATMEWPHVNPSDLWWFVLYRAYCDPYNHPAKFARLDISQSWKRAGGWALEKILVRHYGDFLKRQGVNLYIPDSTRKRALLAMLDGAEFLEADKVDVVLTGDTAEGERTFGVVHVKASFAERRTDDVPMSEKLVRAGYTSPLWTMDCKSTPGPYPKNRGELGAISGQISAKRSDIEERGFFGGCFSYNANTIPSKIGCPPEKRISVCNFNNADDAFSRFIISQWRTFSKA